ncbi:hypothetical protein BZG36_03225 [Bifiguratus adelaidae]|uniref:Myb-like domain-containing protein n=1 Tax=Bifiguratus adelaidae TaxID=1938954 RepID=A0A261XWU7_9FUNG|nr:hypothetical protein BZG36_03225 [Bifiguratus adelaidae]
MPTWSSDEVQLLQKGVEENKTWQQISEELKINFGTIRRPEACRIRYFRHKKPSRQNDNAAGNDRMRQAHQSASISRAHQSYPGHAQSHPASTDAYRDYSSWQRPVPHKIDSLPNHFADVPFHNHLHHTPYQSNEYAPQNFFVTAANMQHQGISATRETPHMSSGTKVPTYHPTYGHLNDPSTQQQNNGWYSTSPAEPNHPMQPLSTQGTPVYTSSYYPTRQP